MKTRRSLFRIVLSGCAGVFPPVAGVSRLDAQSAAQMALCRGCGDLFVCSDVTRQCCRRHPLASSLG
jgi:hypothetical protein